MPNIDVANIITIIVALFGGGVVGVVIKALTEKKKINAEANNTNIKSLLEIDQRMNERMAKLEERVANLEQENYKLSKKGMKWGNKITPQIKQRENQKEINIVINEAVQSVLLNKDSSENILNKAVKSLEIYK